MTFSVLSFLFYFLLISTVCFLFIHFIVRRFWDKKGRVSAPLCLIIALVCVFSVLWVSFCAPDLFSMYPLGSSESANSSGTIYNLMSPFIAILAAILTFMAFWVQFNANQEMLKNNGKQQEERQFYEMLKIHRDNVDKLEWKILKDETEYDIYGLNFFKRPIGYYMGKPQFAVVKKLDHISTTGKAVLRLFLNELILVNECFLEKKEKDFGKVYKIFFEGLDNVNDENKLGELKSLLRDVQQYVNRPNDGKKISNKIKIISNNQGRCNVFKGHRDVLNPYYRHLYHTVAYVADSKIFEKEEKEKFLKILRSQMTSEEQALLLFNWYAGYGTEWECKKVNIENHFFTKYKMIHNIEKPDIECIISVDELKKEFVPKYIDEEGWKRMFEFEERKLKLQEKQQS